MDMSTSNLQEYFRKNIFRGHNNNHSDRANEVVKETQKANDLHDGNKRVLRIEPWGYLLGPVVNWRKVTRWNGMSSRPGMDDEQPH
jgi:hypothetical protein